MDLTVPTFVSSLILALITAYYAVITHKLLRENRRANDFQQSSFDVHTRLAIYPQMFPVITRHAAGKVTVEIANAGDNPAFDVDAYLVCTASIESTDFTTFVSRHVQKRHRNEVFRRLSQIEFAHEFCGVFSHWVFMFFPPRMKKVIEMEVPEEFEMFHLFLQARDALGRNYVRTYWFIPVNGDQRLRVGAMEPVETEPLPRFDRDIGSKDNSLIPLDGSVIPPFVREFNQVLQNSVSGGFTNWTPWEIEDPGDWESIG